MAEEKYMLIVDGKEIKTDDPKISGGEILAMAECRPVSDFFAVVIKGQGTQMVGLDEKIDLGGPEVPQFCTFKGDPFRATLNECEIVWGKTISAKELREIGSISSDQVLYLDSDGDRLIEDSVPVSLSGNGTERIRSGEPGVERVEVLINSEPTLVQKGELSYIELAELAYPELSNIASSDFKIIFSNGPKERPDGTLGKGGKVQTVKGMIFDVTRNDTS